MSRLRNHPEGFTLVELLVVITILVLLIAMLVPVVVRAKSLAVRAQCQVNMKIIGEYTQAFAAGHNGRAPGHSMGYASYDPTQTRSRIWVNYLNVEILGQKHYWQAGQGAIIQYYGPTPIPGQIYCPSMVFFTNLYPRGYQFNQDAGGGAWGYGGLPDEGNYGVKVIPPPPTIPDDLVVSWEYYTLGAYLANFPNPSQQFLLVEGESASNGYCHSIWPAAAPYTVTLNDSPSMPPYAGCGGAFAFRHVLPNDPSLYQTQATGNFLYIDGHVDTLTASDKVNANDRFNYR